MEIRGEPMDSKTLRYIGKRIILAVVTLWAVITITFFVMHAVPGGPFTREKAISAEAQAALEAKYGLDKPLFEQYTTYLTDAIHGNFGPSLKQRGRMVTDIILDGMKTSANAIGFKELIPYFEGSASLEDCIATIQQETRRYAKRQLTWFRRNERIRWIIIEDFGKMNEILEKSKKAMANYRNV